MQGERALEAGEAFGEMSANVPEFARGTRKPRVAGRLGVAGPVERGAQVVVLLLQPIQPLECGGTTQCGLAALRQREEVLEMTPALGISATGIGQLFRGVLADDFEQVVASFRALVVFGHEQ